MNIKEILCENQYLREDSSLYMDKIRSIFLNYFKQKGNFTIQESSSVLEARKYDTSVRFIGSHTNIFKKNIYNRSVPKNGYCISQFCFQTQNLDLYSDPETAIDKGSVFECHGLLSPYKNLNKVADNIYYYFKDKLGILDKVIAYSSSLDKDLYNSIKHFTDLDIRVDKVDLNEIRHSFGDPRLKGRDIKFTLKSETEQKEIPFCALIAMDLDQTPSFVEVSIAPGRILQQIYNLDHYLDIFPLCSIEVKDNKIKRKIEDCIISILFLIHEGLLPGGTGNQRQILRNYFRALKNLIFKSSITVEDLKSILHFLEKKFFHKRESKVDYIISYFSQ